MPHHFAPSLAGPPTNAVGEVGALEQLRALGFSERTVHQRVHADRLYRIHQRVYVKDAVAEAKTRRLLHRPLLREQPGAIAAVAASAASASFSTGSLAATIQILVTLP